MCVDLDQIAAEIAGRDDMSHCRLRQGPQNGQRDGKSQRGYLSEVSSSNSPTPSGPAGTALNWIVLASRGFELMAARTVTAVFGATVLS